jgi:hypothetical protein
MRPSPAADLATPAPTAARSRGLLSGVTLAADQSTVRRVALSWLLRAAPADRRRILQAARRAECSRLSTLGASALVAGTATHAPADRTAPADAARARLARVLRRLAARVTQRAGHRTMRRRREPPPRPPAVRVALTRIIARNAPPACRPLAAAGGIVAA